MPSYFLVMLYLSFPVVTLWPNNILSHLDTLIITIRLSAEDKIYILYLKFLITMAEFRLVLFFFFNDKQFSFLDEVFNCVFIVYSLGKAFFFLLFVCENVLSSTFSVIFFCRENAKKKVYKMHVFCGDFDLKIIFPVQWKIPTKWASVNESNSSWALSHDSKT